MTDDIQYRTLILDATRADEEKRTVEASLSSEEAVDRWAGNEVLLHEEGAVNLSRASSMQLLWNHNTDVVLGVVEALRLEARKLRGVLRFGNSEKAREAWKDVKAGILRNVSIGYKVDEQEKTQDGYKAMRWTLLEVSLVAVPADATVGIGRTYNGGRKVEEKENDKELNRAERRAEKFTERSRVTEILAIGERFKAVDMAREFISSGNSVEEMKAAVLKKIGFSKPLNVSYNPMFEEEARGFGMSNREVERYSLVRALNAVVTGDWSEAGYEREMSKHSMKKRGRDTNGLVIPFEVLQTRAVQKTGSGGYLVETQHMESGFIEMLRKKAAVLRLGAKTLTGLQGDVVIPKQASGSTAYWIGEADDVTESTPTFGHVAMTPKTLGGLVKATRKMLIQSSPSIEDLLRADLSATLGLALDLACIKGKSTDGEPLGILNTTGIGDVAGGVNGAAPTYSHVVGLETAVSAANADQGSLGYLTNSKVRAKLKQTQRFTSTDTPVWGEGDGDFGRVNGYRAEATNQVPDNLTKGTSAGVCSAVIFGNWTDLLIGVWGNGVEVQADPYTDFKSGAVWLRAMLDVDIAVRHPESFAAMLDALTA